MGRDFALTVADLEPSHIADLRRLMESPVHQLPVVRRKLFLRLRLIHPCADIPKPSSFKYARRPKRTYLLTDLGRQLATS